MPWMDQSDLGFMNVDNWYAKKISDHEFIEFQDRCFAALSSVHACSIPKKRPGYPQTLGSRLKYALQCSGKIYTSRIRYFSGNKVFALPSIREMTKRVLFLVGQSTYNTRCVMLHGDFHPPNIVADEHGSLRLIDFADVSYGEDICWDLGKWLNYIKRFHGVTKLRLEGMSASPLSLRIERGVMHLVGKSERDLNVSEVERAVFESVRKNSKLGGRDLYLKTLLAEVAVNILTLDRHIKLFPQTTSAIISCICEAYLKVLAYKEHKNANISL